MERMYDLGIEQLDGGMVRLEQSSGPGESAIIDLHPCQLRLLAELAGLLPPLPVIHSDPPTNDDTGEMHHIAIDSDGDGTIHLYQMQVRGMGGSDEHVMLHPTQAAWLGARLLSLASPAKPIASPPESTGGSDGHRCLPSVAGCDSGHSEPSLF